MDKNSGKSASEKPVTPREERLKAALKENLRRRKEQARARGKTGKS